jgi:hypothetical protein
VKWTQPEQVLAGLLQLDVAPDDIDDVDAGEQVLDESLGDHATKVYAAASALHELSPRSGAARAIRAAKE